MWLPSHTQEFPLCIMANLCFSVAAPHIWLGLLHSLLKVKVASGSLSQFEQILAHNLHQLEMQGCPLASQHAWSPPCFSPRRCSVTQAAVYCYSLSDIKPFSLTAEELVKLNSTSQPCGDVTFLTQCLQGRATCEHWTPLCPCPCSPLTPQIDPSLEMTHFAHTVQETPDFPHPRWPRLPPQSLKIPNPPCRNMFCHPCFSFPPHRP